MKIVNSDGKGGLRVGLANAGGKAKLLGVQLLGGKAGYLSEGSSMRGGTSVNESDWIILLIENLNEGKKSKTSFWINPNSDALGESMHESTRKPDANATTDMLVVNAWSLKGDARGLVDAVAIASDPVEALKALGESDE